jgi:hypothetical protein
MSDRRGKHRPLHLAMAAGRSRELPGSSTRPGNEIMRLLRSAGAKTERKQDGRTTPAEELGRAAGSAVEGNLNTNNQGMRIEGWLGEGPRTDRLLRSMEATLLRS